MQVTNIKVRFAYDDALRCLEPNRKQGSMYLNNISANIYMEANGIKSTVLVRQTRSKLQYIYRPK